MATPKAHEQHAKHSEKVADHKHDPAKAPIPGNGPPASGDAEPTGTPSADRHATETATSK